MKQKSILLLTIVFTLSFATNAQLYYSKEYNYYYAVDNHDHINYGVSADNERNLIYKNRVINNVKSCEKVKTNHKKDTLFTARTSYNKKGRIVAVEKVNRKGRKFDLTAKYSKDTLLTQYVTKHKKTHEEVSFEYNNKGKLVHLLHLKNGNKHYEIKKIYKKGRLLEAISIDYSKRKPKTYKTINTIDTEGKVIKTAYFKNNKLKRTWEYDCSDKGVEVKPKKSEEGVPTSSSCSWKAESNDGSYIYYYRTLNGNNVNLFESHYSKDSSLMKTKIFDENELLKYETSYYDNHKEELWYKPNGKIKRQYTEVLDPELGVVATNSIFYGLGKSHNSIQKTHNKAGLLIELARYSNGKKNTTTMDYSYYSR